MVDRPTAVVDQRGLGVVEPIHAIPLLGPHDGTMAEQGDRLVLNVVGGDVEQDLDETRGILAVDDGVEVVLGHLLGRDVLVQDAGGVGVSQVAVELGVVAPQTQIVDGGGNEHVVAHGEVGQRLAVLLEDALGLEEGLHVGREREAGDAGVALGLVAGLLLHVGHVDLSVAAHGAAVAAGHLDRVLLSSGAHVLGGLHAAIAHGVGLERLGLAGLDGAALGGSPVEALASGPTGAGVVVLGPGLLGARHDVVVVGANDLGDHVVGQVGNHLRVGNVNGRPWCRGRRRP